MNAQLDKHYIDLSPDRCISIDSRHILLRHKSDDSYYQGRPINAIESTLTDEIVSLRAELTALRESVATLTAQNEDQARQIEEAYRMIEFFKSLAVLDEMDYWLSENAPAPQADTEGS